MGSVQPGPQLSPKSIGFQKGYRIPGLFVPIRSRPFSIPAPHFSLLISIFLRGWHSGGSGGKPGPSEGGVVRMAGDATAGLPHPG